MNARILALAFSAVGLGRAGAQSSGARDARQASPPSAPVLLATLRSTAPYTILTGDVSPDGTSIVYVKGDRANQQLWIHDLIHGGDRLLTPGAGVRSSPAWSLDGKQVAYEGTLPVAGASITRKGIWLVDVASGVERLLYGVGELDLIDKPRWTLDGHVMVYELFVTFTGSLSRLVELDPRTGAIRRPVPRPFENVEELAIAPTGDRVAYLGVCGDSSHRHWGLQIMSVGGGQSVTATACLDELAGGTEPVWSLDGRTVYVLESNPGRDAASIVAFDAATGERRTIADSGIDHDVRRISVERDGQIVAMSRAGYIRVGLVPASGGTPTVLQRDTTLMTGMPSWSSDGTVVGAFGARAREWGWHDLGEFVTIAARGAHSAAGAMTRPDPRVDSIAEQAWSPDGRCVIDEASYESRDSSVGMHAENAPSLHFTHGAWSYARRGFPNEMSGYDAATQWDSSSSRILKGAMGALFVLDRDRLAGDVGGCGIAGLPHRVPLREFTGSLIGWRLSPDGRTIAFSGLRADRAGAGVFIVPAEGGAVRQLVVLPNDESVGGPEWSLDGKSLYFAAPNQDGLYRILRLTIATGAVDTITRGPSSALHPQLSPDGRTLAVTIANYSTTVWRIDPGRPTSRVNPPISSLATDSGRAATPLNSAPNEQVLDLVSRVAEVASSLDAIWPQYWRPTQSYAVYVRSPTPGTIFVAQDPVAVGFGPVSVRHAPTSPLHVYWRPGAFEHPEALTVPYVIVDSIPASHGDAATLERWREQTLYSLFYGDGGWLAEPGDRWSLPAARSRGRGTVYRYCESGLQSSCVAVRRLERHILAAAIAAPPNQLRNVMRAYVAVRWIRRATGDDDTWNAERGRGTGIYAARRSAIAAAGGDPARYARDVVDAFRHLATTDVLAWPETDRRAEVMGQTLAILLDRLGPGWKGRLIEGDDFLDALAREVGFDSTRVLREVKRAYHDFDLPRELEAARIPSDTSAATRRQLDFNNIDQHQYYSELAQAFAHDSQPLGIMVTGRGDGTIDSTRFRIRYAAGIGDSVSTPDGLVLLPAPDSFVVDADQFHLAVHRVPVLIESRPWGPGQLMRIVVLVPDSVSNQIRRQNDPPTRAPATPANLRAPSQTQPSSLQEQRIRGAQIDAWFGPTTRVARPNMYPAMVDVWPKPLIP